MSFRNWKHVSARLRLSVDETLAGVSRWLWSAPNGNATPRPLSLSELEERVLFSASPAAAVAPDPSSAETVDVAMVEPSLATVDSEEPHSSLFNDSNLDALLQTIEEDTSGQSKTQELSVTDQAVMSEQEVRRELVFVDTSAADYQQLLDDLWSNDDPTREIHVVLLTSDRDGIDQISEALAGYDDLDAVHIVSHGTDAAVKLGSSWLTADNLGAYAGQISDWQDSLTSGADLLLYGCDLAANEDGKLLVDSLSALTGADVAASTDNTGSAILGGDWDLEYEVGGIETAVAFSIDVRQDWFGLLDAAPAGGEILVNTTTADTQQTSFDSVPAVATDADGDYVIAWASRNQDGDRYGVYAQRYNANGIPQGSEFRVNTNTSKDQLDPSVAIDANGNFVITWSSKAQDQGNTWGVYGQRYDASGVAQGSEFLVNTTTAGDQKWSGVAMDADGDFVVTWTGLDASVTGVYAQRYNAAGVAQGGEFLVNTTTASNQDNSTIAMDDAGNFVVTWSSFDQDKANSWGIYAQRYNAAGVAQGGEFLVNTTTNSDQYYSRVAMDADGDFAIVWENLAADIFGQRYDSVGVAQGGEFPVNTTTTGTQWSSGVAMDAAGNFVVTWESIGQDGDLAGIYAQEYNADGTTDGGEFLVNTTTSGAQQNASVAMDDAGDYVVVWSGNGPGDGSGVFAQRFEEPTAASGFYVSTVADVISPSGAPGLDAWVDGDVLEFADPNLALDPGVTNGTFSNLFNIDAFAANSTAEIDAIHYVTTSITIGTGITVDLQPGDLLLSTVLNETLTSNNTISVFDDDVFVFRPDTLGDYSVGTFIFLLDNPTGADIGGMSLVEQATLVGDTTLPAGAFILVSGASLARQDIHLFTPTDVGETTTSGMYQLLITGSDINFGEGIHGLELIETSTTVGGVTLTSGQILISLDNNDSSVGDNIIAADQQDIFYLDVTTTTLVGGTSAANATLLLDGSDVGLDTAAEDINSLTLVPGPGSNVAPTISLPAAAVNYTENSGAVLIDSSATASDSDSADFDTGTLTIDFSANGTANDRLAIRNEGTAVGQIGVSGSNVTYNFGAGAVTIGTFTGGTDGSTPLVITFNASATPVAAQALMRNITYENVSENPSTSPRSVRFVLTDGDGGTGNAATQTINVAAVADHLVTVNTTSDTSDGNTASIDALLANKGADGFISLREAITAANNTTNFDASTPDQIEFEILDELVGSAHTIDLLSALPFISDSVIIDGTTDSDFGSSPIIELNGTSAGSGVDGLRLNAGSDGSTIRGLVINRFADDGITINGTDNHLIVGNFIGTDVTGTVDLGNSDDGIVVYNGASGVTIGGTAAGDGNLISGNDSDGIQVGSASTSAPNTTIQGNLIGTDITGTLNLGNTQAGIDIEGGTNNLIGGTAANAGNSIAFNGGRGVEVSAGVTQSSFLGNALFGNALLGIDLNVDGVTANDAGDGDTGANNLQNYPALTSAATDGSTKVLIDGTLNSTAGTTFRIEFFASSAQDVSGYGEAETYLGFTTVTTDGSGNASFSTSVSATVAAGQFVTATATVDLGGGSYGDTSEFSQNVVATLDNVAPTISLPGGAVNYAENDPATVIDAAATAADADSTDFDTGTLTIDFTANGTADDRLAIRDEGIGVGQIGVSGSNVTYNFGAGAVTIGTFAGGTDGSMPLVITLNASSTPIAAQALMQNITYKNVSQNPTTSARTVRFVLTDGDGGTSNVETETINVTAVNDKPSIFNLAGDSFVYTEGDGAVVLEQGGNATVADVDSLDFDGGTLTVNMGSGHIPTEDVLSVRNQGTGVGEIGFSGGIVTYGGTLIGTPSGGSSGSPLVISLNANANPTSVTALIRNITYQNTNTDDPMPGAKSIRTTLTDGDGGTSNGNDVFVTLVATNDDPVITSASSTSVAENQTAVLTVMSTDVDGGAQTYSLTGGADQAKFSINSSTGELTFNTAPDFENPTDVGTNNVYEVQVTVSDGNGGTDVQLISVTVTDANDAPVITSSSSPSVAENTTGVTTVTASDADLPGDTLTYSISGGGDAAKFSINATTGVLSFLAAPDFENPTDVGTNNVYDVTIQVSDGSLTDIQAISVTAELRRCAGNQFDPALVERFIQMVKLRLQDTEIKTDAVSKQTALQIGLQIERLVAALDNQDLSQLQTMAGRLKRVAEKNQIESIAQKSLQLEEAVSSKGELLDVLCTAGELIDLCRETQSIWLTKDDPDEIVKKETALATSL